MFKDSVKVHFYKFAHFLLKAQYSLLLLCVSLTVQAQQTDSLRTTPPDTLQHTPKAKSDIQDIITFSAKDSAIFEMDARRGWLYREAQIDYGNSRLQAAVIRIDLERNIVQARPLPDSTGRPEGRPVFTEGSEQFVADSMDYNLKSKRGIIFNIVSEQSEGFVGGAKVKRSPENEFYIAGGYYTTCNLAHPHYRIKASKIKLTKNQNVICGPFHMELADIPTPLGFAFGIFPKPRQKKSGIIVPVYGESQQNGFFLRNGGYYWAISDYMDLKLLGEVYTYGNWGIQAVSNFKRRYQYSGNLSVSYNVRYDENTESILRSETKLFWVNGSFTPESRGDGRFAASLNFGSSQFNRRVSFDLANQLTNTFQSNVSYSRRFRGTPFTLTLSARHNQENNTGVVNLNLPTFTLGMTPLYPFKSKTGNNRGFFSQLNVAYTLNGSFDITNRVTSPSYNFKVANIGESIDSVYAFRPENFDLFVERGKMNLQHSIPVSLPFKVLKYLNASVGFNFSQRFYREKYRYTWLDSEQAVQIDTLKEWGSSYQYSLSSGLSTNIYGTFYPKRGRFSAIRHLVQPTIGFGYAPDFSGENYGFYQRTQTGIDGNGNPVYQDLPTFSGVSAPGASASISFGVRNTLEAKLRPKSDTAAAKKAEKVKLLDELSVTGSYNLLADTTKGQYPLSDLLFRARTRVGGLFDLNLSATLAPYAFRDTLIGEQVSRIKSYTYAWDAGQGIGRFTNFDMSVSASLNPDVLRGKRGTTTATPEPVPGSLRNPTTAITDPLQAPETSYEAYYQASPDQYVDFDIPWNLRFNYKFTYNFLSTQRPVTQSLSFSGDMSLTPKWRIGFSSGFDFTQGRLSTTSLDFYRDLHCWEMLFNWRPFGQFQSYSFTIRVKASTLRDLRLERKRTWYDNQ